MAEMPAQKDLLYKGHFEHEPISLVDDDDDVAVHGHVPERSTEVEDIIRRRDAARLRQEVVHVDEEDSALDDEIKRIVEDDEAELMKEIERIDLTQEDPYIQRPAQISRLCTHIPQRNSSLHSTPRSVGEHSVNNGSRFKINDFVELIEHIGEWSIQFIEVKAIWVNQDEVTLCGIPYARTRYLHGRLEHKRNEVCQILEVDANDVRTIEEQAFMEISVNQVLTTRVLHKTNAPFPQHRFGDDPGWLLKSKAKREEQGPLTCRWKMRIDYQAARYRRNGRPLGGALIHLTADDVQDQAYRTPDQERREAWRGKEPESYQRGRRYTFCDAFCGAGGTSRGAMMADFVPVMAIDHWAPACLSYQRNFRGARLYQQEITDFINSLAECPRIDILHISPPCQFFSPAHVHAGPNDEANTAALFACTDLVKKLRPRMVTLEQTFGLLHDRHAPFFNALVQGFTCHGYTIQWKFVHLVEYGLPQKRRRLIMIGAAPGEKLPPWPAATHGPGLKPYVTEIQAIGRIPRNAPLHDVHAARRRDAIPRDGNTPLSRTITCSGADTGHYSGLRDYTPRELACLQGFPLSHAFEGHCVGVIKKQIGNAFPPCVVKVIYQHLGRWLERVDGRLAAPAQPQPSPLPPMAMGQDVALASAFTPCRSNNTRPSIAPATATGFERPARRGSLPYQGYNGDLSEDDALEVALQESRTVKEPVAPHAPVIILEDSDEEDQLVREATESLDRLSVALVPEPDLSPPSSTASSSQNLNDTPRSLWDFLQSPMTSSRASSVTLGFSPTPSPSLRAKRKFDALKGDESESKMEESPPGPPPKRERTEVDGDDHSDNDVEIILGMSSQSLVAEADGREASQAVSSFASRMRREASVLTLQDAGRALSFGNKLGKLPVRRDGSKDWEF